MLGERKPQTYANHRRFIPLFHFMTFGLLAVNFLWRCWVTVTLFHPGALVDLGLAVALLLLAIYVRLFATRLQDRIIRLEMWVRLHEVLPADLRSRIPELGVGRLIALRFAPDEELPDLVRRTLDDRAFGHDAIKRAIRTWEPDYLRV
jgi:uncharacterized protein DUF6526